jgi:16S rRNA (cytosine967-C5)-methyltransferase
MPALSPDLLRIAVDVIQAADREHPADSVLRTHLKRYGKVESSERALISQSVFAYYRWWGWLAQHRNPSRQLAMARELDRRYRTQPEAFSDLELMQKAVPSWILKHLEATSEWVRSLQSEARLWLRPRVDRVDRVAAQLGDCVPLPSRTTPTALWYAGPRDLFHTPEYRAGWFEVQDLSSQAVGWICQPLPGETWWDVCAGEGGKTLHLSDLMRNRGLIWATDRAAWRLQRFRRRAARAGVFNYRAMLWDGGKRGPLKTRCDGILVDAPCSGVGTWQRNPHARWTTTERDIAELSEIQFNLLNQVASSVKPGGKLVYSVCTLTLAETREVCDRFERANPEFQPCRCPDPLRPGGEETARFHFWPQTHDGNGMFVAVWRRA